MSDSVITVENLNKVYTLYDRPSDRLKEALGLKVNSSKHYALNDVSFQVNKGETIGIIGTNGSGKSTCLKIITGVLNPTSGSVTVNGRISALLELGAGFNPEYSGLENVFLNGTMMGFTREEIEAKMDNILSFADIGDYIHQPVKSYSSGMFVRLAFAVAINIEPEILIVDEALSVGDVFFQAKCYKKIEEFRQNGKTILLVSHDLGSISKYCDRVVLLNNGEKLAEGKPREMVDLFKKVLVKQEGELAYEEDPDQNDIEKLNSDSVEKTNGWDKPFPINPEVLEYGNKLVEIIDFTVLDETGLPTNAIEKFSEFTIKMKVKFHKDLEDAIYAFTIKDLKGTEITGTNSMFEKVEMNARRKNSEVEISFTQKMTIQGGEYLLSLGCTGYPQGEFDVYHRLYDICNITVVSSKDTVGFFDTDSQITVRDS
ncbi:ABC transporter ATP-binding protein [Enterococcus sp. BWB1-3]|uniref:ABC transporter ATP-binding protein n=1 Tax=Enterococcus sp. BWB1-3 TaxID=2787713 RepID=UPI001922B7EA|nr:ABC transporter ATP-binding protein [Enterococcus sp. BWB1-3]MBL1229658.1 ABC transporter ATP-binding protein [Enterococcus sp. BWB1-3]